MIYTKGFYKPGLEKYLQTGWKSGLLLLLIFSIPRIIIVLHANLTGNYQFVSIIFIAMWLMPFLILSNEGRNRIGWKKPENYLWLLWGMLLGIACCSTIFLISTLFFAKSENNALVYISKTYVNVPANLDDASRLVFFLIYTGISMLFSPLGEELFYRGIIHENFAHDFGNRMASMLDSLAFAIVHLAHFGIVYRNGNWELLYFPGFLWVLSLFGSCLLFYISRIKSGSIFGSILAHAGFNLAMNYFIFYHIF